ncbi:hypothetical protein [Allocoleopsis franciscana]|nr:hypothetical protein [Allocoleopsis franciscana]
MALIQGTIAKLSLQARVRIGATLPSTPEEYSDKASKMLRIYS